MLIVLDVKAPVESIQRVQSFLKDHGIESQAHSDQHSQTIIAPNASKKLTIRQLEAFEDVVRAVPITSPYKYASIQGVNTPTVIDVAGIRIGDGSLCLVGDLAQWSLAINFLESPAMWQNLVLNYFGLEPINLELALTLFRDSGLKASLYSPRSRKNFPSES